jgi:hypothetical protein
MSERAFRGVVAVVLVLALVLAFVVALATLYRPAPPPPSPSSATSRTPAPTGPASPTETPFTGPAFKTPGVISVGLVERGSISDASLVLDFVESQADAIPNGPGSFVVSLADSAGDRSTVAFAGAPTIDAPGSLGATATFTASGDLLIEIVASDPLNIEPLTIRGLEISASQTAAIGPVTAEVGGFGGSLSSGIATNRLASPASVTEPR